MTTDILEPILEEGELRMKSSSGELHTREEALEEELLLDKRMNEFFSAHPELNIPIEEMYEIEEEEDKAETEPEEAEGATEVLSKNGFSFVEEALLRAVISEVISEINIESMKVEDALSLSVSLPSSSPLDNLYDAYRKEKNHFSSLLCEDEIPLGKAPKHVQEKVQFKTERFLAELLQEHFRRDERRKETEEKMDALSKRIDELEEENKKCLQKLNDQKTSPTVS